MSFNLMQLIPGVGHEYSHVATAGAVSGALVVASFAARKALGTGDQSIVPADKFSLRGAFELATEFVIGLVDMVIGHHGRKYAPMFIAIFVFILVNNLVGVIPGMTPATENMNTTLPMGVFIFLVFNYLGFKEHGPGYLKHFMGPILWLAPLMVVVEIISTLVRPASLGLRLANVMGGDHKVVAIFLDLVPILVPIPFYLMGIFISFVQAFVFTLLSMVYISLATAHEH